MKTIFLHKTQITPSVQKLQRGRLFFQLNGWSPIVPFNPQKLGCGNSTILAQHQFLLKNTGIQKGSRGFLW